MAEINGVEYKVAPNGVKRGAQSSFITLFVEQFFHVVFSIVSEKDENNPMVLQYKEDWDNNGIAAMTNTKPATVRSTILGLYGSHAMPYRKPSRKDRIDELEKRVTALENIISHEEKMDEPSEWVSPKPAPISHPPFPTQGQGRK